MKTDTVRSTLAAMVNAHEKTLFGLIIMIAITLRFYGISSWLITNIDEVSALNQIDLPFLSGACTHSNFLLTTILLKTIGSAIVFPAIRILTATVNIIALWTTYTVMRRLTSAGAALTTLLLLTCSWNVLYYSRLFECGSFDPSVACFFMSMVLLWIQKPEKVEWLYGAGFLLGFHLNSHVMPCAYAMTIFFLFLLIQLKMRRLTLKNLLLCTGAFIAGTIPYIYTSIAYPKFNTALGSLYGTLSMAPVPHIAINFRNPLYYLRTLTEYVTFYPLPGKPYLLLGFSLASITVVLIGALSTPRSQLKSYLSLMTFASLVLIGISPFPVYNEGHLHFFWPHFIALLSLLLFESGKTLQKALFLICLMVLILNSLWLPHIFQNQVSEVEQVLNEHLRKGENIYMSDGAMLKLKWLPAYGKLEEHAITLFYCYGPEAMKPFISPDIKEEAMVITTSDAQWPPPSFSGKIQSTLLLSQEQLMEAYQSHGLRIYSIRPLPAPPQGPSSP